MSTTKQLVLHYDWQLSGAFPDVPLNPNVNIAELQQLEHENDKPVFITLPIAKDNLVATDGFKYTAPVNDAIMRALQTEGITGNMGHISPEERNSKYPMPVGIWVGAMKDADGVTWAKAYVRDAGFKEFVRQLKATNSTISTSIYASYDQSTVKFDAAGNWEIDPSSLSLEHLDFAPPKRAALQFERQFAITNHMDSNGEEQDMDKATILAQMTVDEVPENVRQAIIDGLKKDREDDSKLAQMQTELNDRETVISQMRTQLENSTGELYEMRVDARISEAIQVEDDSLIDYVKTKVLAQMSKVKPEERTVEAIDAAIVSVTEQETYKGLATAIVAQMSGGKVVGTQGKPVTTDDKQTLRDKAVDFNENMFARAIRG